MCGSDDCDVRCNGNIVSDINTAASPSNYKIIDCGVLAYNEILRTIKVASHKDARTFSISNFITFR